MTTIEGFLAPGRRFAVLLLTLVSMLFVPVLLPGQVEAVVGPILFMLVLLAALASVADTRRRIVRATMLALPATSLMVAASLIHSAVLIVSAATVAILLTIVASGTILSYVFRAHEVDAGVILGALCVYMIAAVTWAEFYGLIEHLRPGSFSFPPVDTLAGTRGVLQYFSFVTITTVGYGDVLPVSPLARAAAATEAILGQMYLVVLVARLVGLHTAEEARRRG